MNVYIDGRKFSNTGSKMKNKPKKKVSISISEANFDKIENITKDNPEQTRSSVIDYALDMDLEEVKELLKNPIQLEKEILKRRLEDLEKQ